MSFSAIWGWLNFYLDKSNTCNISNFYKFKYANNKLNFKYKKI